MPENVGTHASVLWHGDLHLQNIFVNPNDPTQIMGIIDWQSVSACPLFMQVTRPGFFDYNGPPPTELGAVNLPPNFDSLTAEEEEKARALHQAQNLHNAYLVFSLKKNPPAFQAMQDQGSLRQQVSVVPGLTLADSEPCLTGLLREVQKEWPKIVRKDAGQPSVPCPLQFSAAEVEQQEKDEKLWAEGVDLMTGFIGGTGAFKNWDGRVAEADYELQGRNWRMGFGGFWTARQGTKKSGGCGVRHCHL